MRSTLALLALGAASVSAVAVPPSIDQMKRNIIARQSKNSLVKRNSVTTGASDAVILEFALILEHLENVFYSEALQKFSEADFEAAGYKGVYPLLEQVAYDEATHVEFLTTALKAAGVENPPQQCTYGFPYSDVKGFLGLSQVIENVGVSAYLGAAGDISDPGYVTAAGSILTVEARHNGFIRLLNSYTPFPAPFDTPQSAANVVSIVSPFFKSCPEGSAPAIKGPPGLTVSSGLAAKMGDTITLAPTNSSEVDLSKYKVYCGFASSLDAAFTEYENGSCKVPTENITTGQTYVTLTRWTTLEDKFVLAGPGIIDTTPQNSTVTIPSPAAASNSSSASSTAMASSSAMPTESAMSSMSAMGSMSSMASMPVASIRSVVSSVVASVRAPSASASA
ncbi:ferritin-like domain-containing protein [Sporobolomyces koalae]|uniref:ferritin-like domain-containing protein n=1 Tax=Sporobolomyces koalae TaxID=500713 RepID=UPI003177EE7D